MIARRRGIPAAALLAGGLHRSEFSSRALADVDAVRRDPFARVDPPTTQSWGPAPGAPIEDISLVAAELAGTAPAYAVDPLAELRSRHAAEVRAEIRRIADARSYRGPSLEQQLQASLDAEHCRRGSAVDAFAAGLAQAIADDARQCLGCGGPCPRGEVCADCEERADSTRTLYRDRLDARGER